jgi:hypothetical protein
MSCVRFTALLRGGCSALVNRWFVAAAAVAAHAAAAAAAANSAATAIFLLQTMQPNSQISIESFSCSQPVSHLGDTEKVL